MAEAHREDHEPESRLADGHVDHSDLAVIAASWRERTLALAEEIGVLRERAAVATQAAIDACDRALVVLRLGRGPTRPDEDQSSSPTRRQPHG